jgi:RNA polymerase sigma-70 factor, ECF subfamily
MENERKIVAQAKRNPKYFFELYDFYYPKLYAYVLSRTRHKERAEDVVSTAFTKALDNIQKYNWKKSATFGSWLFRIARNEMLDRVKKEQRVNLTETSEMERIGGITPDASADLIEQEIEQDEKDRIRKILNAMKSLSETEQEVISLKYFSEMSYKEIALIMQKRPNTLAVLLRRALGKLRMDLKV